MRSLQLHARQSGALPPKSPKFQPLTICTLRVTWASMRHLGFLHWPARQHKFHKIAAMEPNEPIMCPSSCRMIRCIRVQPGVLAVLYEHVHRSVN